MWFGEIWRQNSKSLCLCDDSMAETPLALRTARKFVVLFNLVNAWREFAHPHERAVKPLRDSLIFWFLLGEKKLQNRLIIFKCYSILTAICWLYSAQLLIWRTEQNSNRKPRPFVLCWHLVQKVETRKKKTVQIVQILGPPQQLKKNTRKMLP